MPRWPLTVVFLAAVSAFAPAAAAQGPENVLVVANDAVPGSVEIAQRYIAARRVPADQLVRLKAPSVPQISWTEFERDIQAPLVSWLAGHGAQDRILYVVLTRGVPLRIAGTSGRTGTSASVDSEIALLYRRMTGVVVGPNGPVPNPYFLGDASIDAAKPFTHKAHDIYLVTRLDGFTVDDALALIDRAGAPAKNGRFLLDGTPASEDARSTWLQSTATRLAAAGFGDRVVHDTTSRALVREADVLGYVSRGSNDPSLPMRQPELTFVNGAIASMFLSSDARTFAEPPENWKPGVASLGGTFAGSNQMLIADLVRSGVTGVSGNIAEAYVDGAVRPDLLFPAYAAGFNLAEAFYLATPYVSWQTVVVGDPLCAPFRGARQAIAREDIDPPVDPETELPAAYAARRLAAMRAAAKDPSALKLMVRAESRLSRGNPTGAVDALEAAVFTEPTAVAAWRALGMAHEQTRDYARASDAYRRLLAIDRNDLIALNNLAYIVGVRQNRPKEAVDLATRASTLSKGNPLIDDTLGWIHHLLGNDEEAVRLLSRASRMATGSAEVQLHAAVVFAATGRLAEANKALQAAMALDAGLKDRADVRELQRKLQDHPGGDTR